MVDFFRWGNPAALNLLWLVPVLSLVHMWAMVRRRKALEAFCPDYTAERTGLISMLRRRSFKFGLFACGLIFLIVSLAQPMVGEKKEKARRKGAELVIAIDTSLSMAAKDVEPNRLEAAKKAAATIISRLNNDRIGIVVFAGTAHKYCPLTIDQDAALMFLDSISLSSTPQPGTAIGQAIQISGEILAKAESKHRALLLISDGEDHASGVLDAVNKVNRETGAAILVLGVGTPEGDPLPMTQGDGSVSDLKRDDKGEVVISHLQEAELREIAKAGNGAYRRLDDGSAISQITSRIESLEGVQIGTYVYTDYGQRYQWPLVLALLLFAVEALIAEQRLSVERRREVEDGADS